MSWVWTIKQWPTGQTSCEVFCSEELLRNPVRLGCCRQNTGCKTQAWQPARQTSWAQVGVWSCWFGNRRFLYGNGRPAWSCHPGVNNTQSHQLTCRQWPKESRCRRFTPVTSCRRWPVRGVCRLQRVKLHCILCCVSCASAAHGPSLVQKNVPRSNGSDLRPGRSSTSACTATLAVRK